MSERRRSQRITQQITIQLVGMQPGAAAAVAQPAQTIDVSESGALIECRSKFELGSEVMIHNPKSLQNDLFKVIWVRLSPAGSSWHMAVEKQQQSTSEDFWGSR